jgi:hypothetical protein
MIGRLIGLLLSNQQCYIKCTEYANAQEMCALDRFRREKDGSIDSLVLARFCPEKEKLCQAQCYQMSRSGNKEISIFNIKSWESSWGIKPRELLEAAYHNWKKGGIEIHMDNILTDDSDMGVLSTVELPVCDSEPGYININDFRHKHDEKLYRNFPVSCGNFRSNETEMFLDNVRMGPGHSHYDNWDLRGVFEHYAPVQIDGLKLDPADRFLAYCHLGIMFPRATAKQVYGAIMEPAPECVEVIAETKDMGQVEMNIWFCAGSKPGRAVQEREHKKRITIYGANIRSSHALCKKYLKNLGRVPSKEEIAEMANKAGSSSIDAFDEWLDEEE